MGLCQELQSGVEALGDWQENWKRKNEVYHQFAQLSMILIFQMWRDLPDEDKKEFIDEYEVEKVSNISFLHLSLFNLFIKS